MIPFGNNSLPARAPGIYIVDARSIHFIAYHLIWCTKRRKPVLTGEVARDCERLIRDHCDLRGWDIFELVFHPNGVQLYLRVPPETSAAEALREIRHTTAHELRLRHPMLKRLPSLWTRPALTSTTYVADLATIKSYIEMQKGC